MPARENMTLAGAVGDDVDKLRRRRQEDDNVVIEIWADTVAAARHLYEESARTNKHKNMKI